MQNVKHSVEIFGWRMSVAVLLVSLCAKMLKPNANSPAGWHRQEASATENCVVDGLGISQVWRRWCYTHAMAMWRRRRRRLVQNRFRNYVKICRLSTVPSESRRMIVMWHDDLSSSCRSILHEYVESLKVENYSNARLRKSVSPKYPCNIWLMNSKVFGSILCLTCEQ